MKYKLLTTLPCLYDAFESIEKEKIYRECIAELIRSNGAEYIRGVFVPSPSSSLSCLVAPTELIVDVLSKNVETLLSNGAVISKEGDDDGDDSIMDTDEDKEDDHETVNITMVKQPSASNAFIMSLSTVTLLLECLFHDMDTEEDIHTHTMNTMLCSDLMKICMKTLILLNTNKILSSVLSAAYTQSLILEVMNKLIFNQEFIEYLASSPAALPSSSKAVSTSKKKRSTRGATQSNSLTDLKKNENEGLTYTLESLHKDMDIIVCKLLISSYAPTREASLELLHKTAPLIPDKILDSIELLGNVITKTNEPTSKNTTTMISGEDNDRDQIIVETLRTFVEVIRTAKNFSHHDTHQIVTHAFFKHIYAFPQSRRR